MITRLYHATIDETDVIVRLRSDDKHVNEFITKKRFPVDGALNTPLPHTCKLKGKIDNYFDVIAFDSSMDSDIEYIKEISRYHQENQQAYAELNVKDKKPIKVKIKQRCFNLLCPSRRKKKRK